jgi:hypothetical protein
MDSSGFRFDKASHWYETKYNKPCDQKPWRKLHLSMDAGMETYAVELTEQDVNDKEVRHLRRSRWLDEFYRPKGGLYPGESVHLFFRIFRFDRILLAREYTF